MLRCKCAGLTRSNSDENGTEWIYWKGNQYWGCSFPSLSLLCLFPLFQHTAATVWTKKAGTPWFPWEVAQSCSGFSCICSLLFYSLLQDIEDTLEQAKHMNIYCHFAKGLREPGYRPVPSWEELNQILVEALDSYNEVNAAMDLVLFEDAMSHV